MEDINSSNFMGVFVFLFRLIRRKSQFFWWKFLTYDPLFFPEDFSSQWMFLQAIKKCYKKTARW